MTQEKIAYLKSQNWYPACYQNTVSYVGYPRDFDFDEFLHEHLTRSFGWGFSPQMWVYWNTLYVRLFNEGL